jgi:hypothetical protein
MAAQLEGQSLSNPLLNVTWPALVLVLEMYRRYPSSETHANCG